MHHKNKLFKKDMKDGHHGKGHFEHGKHHGWHHEHGFDKSGDKITNDESHNYNSLHASGPKNRKNDAKAIINADQCTGCGKCVRLCPADAISMSAPGGKASVNKDSCIGCSKCVRVCPEDAISMS